MKTVLGFIVAPMLAMISYDLSLRIPTYGITAFNRVLTADILSWTPHYIALVITSIPVLFIARKIYKWSFAVCLVSAFITVGVVTYFISLILNSRGIEINILMPEALIGAVIGAAIYGVAFWVFVRNSHY